MFIQSVFGSVQWKPRGFIARSRYSRLFVHNTHTPMDIVCESFGSSVECLIHFFLNILKEKCLQCFDAVGWAAGRASGLQKN